MHAVGLAKHPRIINAKSESPDPNVQMLKLLKGAINDRQYAVSGFDIFKKDNQHLLSTTLMSVFYSQDIYVSSEEI